MHLGQQINVWSEVPLDWYFYTKGGKSTLDFPFRKPNPISSDLINDQYECPLTRIYAMNLHFFQFDTYVTIIQHWI